MMKLFFIFHSNIPGTIVVLIPPAGTIIRIEKEKTKKRDAQICTKFRNANEIVLNSMGIACVII